MKLPVATLLTFAAISLTACGGPSADLEYLDSRVLPDLEIPPDLTQVNVDSDFALPAIFSADGAESGNGIPVLASVDSINLEGHSDYYWLSIDEPVANLYQLVKDFWASEGFTLVMDEPVIGIMKTDWVFSEEGKGDEDKGFFARLFSPDDRAAQQDQFKTRIARDAGTNASQVYISHRGTEYQHVKINYQNEYEETKNWKFRAFEPELEVEMLSRLMLYLGLRQSEVDGQLANIKLFSPRASLKIEFSDEETVDETYILVKDEYTRTWYRTLHQLERLNFEVVSADISSGLGKKGEIVVKTDIEIEDKGLFSFLFDTQYVKKQIKLIFSEEEHDITRIEMGGSKDESGSSPESVEFLTLLYQHIK